MSKGRILLIVIIFIFPMTLLAQKVENKAILYIDIGVKYAVGEGPAGPILGLSLDYSSSKFAYNFRGDLV